eukprot:gene8995-6317_t
MLFVIVTEGNPKKKVPAKVLSQKTYPMNKNQYIASILMITLKKLYPYFFFLRLHDWKREKSGEEKFASVKKRKVIERMAAVASGPDDIINLPLNTLGDAVTFFKVLEKLRSQSKPFPPLSHIFFARVDTGLDFNPYAIRAVSRDDRPNNYYVITKQHVVHVDRMNSVYTVVSSVESWLRDAALFSQIRQLRFFRSYIKTKALCLWLSKARELRLRKSRTLLSKQLLLCRPEFSSDIAQASKFAFDLQWKRQSSPRHGIFGNPHAVRCLSVYADKMTETGFSSEEFLTIQGNSSQDLKKYIADVLVNLLTKVIRKCKKIEQSIIDMPKLEEFKGVTGTVNKKVAAEQRHIKERQQKKIVVAYGNIAGMVRLAHHLQVEAIFKQATQTFFELERVVNHKDALRLSVWLFKVDCVVEHSELTLLPPRDHITELVRTVLANSFDTLASIPTTMDSTETPKEVVKHVTTMSPRRIFAGDAILLQQFQNIITKVQDDYTEAMKRLTAYESFLNASSFISEWVDVDVRWQSIIRSSPSLIGVIGENEIRGYIVKSLKLQSDIKKMTGRNCGTILITCENTITSLTSKLTSITYQIKDTLQTLTASQLETLKTELDTWVEKLTSPDLALDVYIEWLLQVREAEEVYEKFADKVSDLQNLYHLQTELQEKIKNEDAVDEPDLSSALRDVFMQKLSSAKNYHHMSVSKVKERLLQDYNRIIASLQEMEKRLESTFCTLKANEGTPALTRLEKVQESLQRRRQESRRLDGYIEILEMNPLNWTEIGIAEEELRKYVDLWKAFDEAEQLKDKLRKTPVSELDGQDLKDTIISLFQRSFKSSKLTPGDAAESLIEFLTEEKAKLNIYVELCNPALKDEYWSQMFAITKVGHIPTAGRTLRALAAAGLLSGHEEAITEIVSNAVGVFELEQHISKIEKYWDECVFEVSPYAGRANAFVLDGADELLEELEEQQVVVQTCLASKFLASVQSEVEDWEKKLAMIRSVIMEWVNVQKAWMYLEFIFSSDDIKRQLPDESLLFSSADRFFSTLMKRCAADPHVAPLCLEGDALKKLEKCTYQLDCIQKKLDEYLETKRVAFPRFYFLSNDELLSILSDSRNPLAVQPHLQKCFDNIKELIFSDPKTITAMKSSEGEVVEYSHEVKIMGNVESWLNDVERAMRDTLFDRLTICVAAYSVERRNEWFFEHPAQCVATADQLVWTADVEKTIIGAATSADSWPNYQDWFCSQLLSTVDQVKRNLTSLERTIVSNLIVVDVHCRDINSQLLEVNCNTLVNFDWQKQLRYYWTEPTPESKVKDCVIRHGAATLSYGYEYLGNQPRLVITPLTERAFLTCTAALHMQKGAAPQGPAGTGKTESVKDLGKALARQVVVFNCSDGLNYKMMSQMFAGLAQGGAWACFDEFNRIELEVLSVVAQQMLDITTAIAQNQHSMLFEGHRIKLHPNFGVFITMNPGYAGRTELPDNLKALFRPICMMIPNYALIAEIMFYSEGYSNAGNLAKKMIRLYSLASQQLSKQDHYDFGMRAVKSILVLAGRLKRVEPDTDEELLLVKAIRGANLPKFLTDDTHLFLALVQDFFPDVTEVSEGEVNVVVGEETRKVLVENQKQGTEGMISKSQQLFDTLTTRHGLMLVGFTMNGKSTVMDALMQALTNLGRRTQELERLGSRYLSYFITTNKTTCNPKSITMTELYGDVNPLTREWQDGVFSSIVRDLVKQAASGNTARHWVVFDGPVDAIWIENLNTVLDDSKMLCLVNGERIRIPETISLLFEVQDLRVASPATVSRCGMVYVDGQTLDDGWTPILTTLSEAAQLEIGDRWRHKRFMDLCKMFLPDLVPFMRKNCKEYIRSVNGQLASAMFHVLKASVMELNKIMDAPPEEESNKNRRRSSSRRNTVRAVAVAMGDSLFDALFIQGCIWGIGGNLSDGFREKFSQHLINLMRSHKIPLPSEESDVNLYDYCVDLTMGQWKPWSELVPSFQYDASLSFFDLVVPTEHTVVLDFLLRTATTVQHHVLLNGLTGTAKSSTVNNFLMTTLKTEDAGSEYTSFSYTLSAQTSSNNLQETIESKLTKRKGDRELGPPVGKKAMIALIDDCNVPQLEEYGAAPPVELLRQMVVQGGFFDRKKLFFKEVVLTMLIGCCGEPGGGKNELTQRLTSKMMCFCVPQLSQAAMRTIFVTILQSFFEARSFSEEVTQLAGAAVDSTLEAYRRIAVECLPTPEKTHCTYNLRDVSKVVQGMLQVKPAHCATKQSLYRLWSHESSRVFHDRLVDDSDRGWWWQCSKEIIAKNFSEEVDDKVLRPIMFGNWGGSGSDYQEIIPGPKTQDVVYQCLAEYNMQSATSMDLVLFSEAVQHLSRLCRVINQPRGHALLIGVGGSGRSSLCRLAASMMSMDLQTVNIVRGYGAEDFRDEMRKALLDAGARGKEVVFMLSDPQIVCSQMLEDINNVLNIGEVPGMMRLEDMEVILRYCREGCLNSGRPDTRTSIYQYFVSHSRERMHVALCMSPMSNSFRERLRMFPALVNCTTIDWFTEWPEDALVAVAVSVLKKNEKSEEDAANNESLSRLMVFIHSSVKKASADLFEQQHRRNHTTPTSYLAALELYQVMLKDLCLQLDNNAKRYRNGLQKLEGANNTIADLKQQISDMQPALNAAAAQAEEQKKFVQKEQKDADVMRREMSKEEAAAKELMSEAEGIRQECEEGLAEALPALEAAEKALDALSPKDIQEIKTFATPPLNVEKTMNAVLILLKEKEGWASAKMCLSKMDFISRLTGYKKDVDLTPQVIRKVAAFTEDEEFTPEIIEKTSMACKSMCMWVHAMYSYYFVAKAVAPKKERLREAEEKLETKQAALRKVLDKIADLEAAAKEAQDQADALNRQIETARARLLRADQLTQGLASERVRWIESLHTLKEQRTKVVGTSALGAGCVAYLGAFTTAFRDHLVSAWREHCTAMNITYDEAFALEKMLPENVVQQWALQSLPRDTFSVQNATILQRSARWCYMIDPQGQANAFIRKRDGGSSHGLLVLKLTDDNFMRSVENAVQVGQPVLLENVGETLDASLDPILLKQVRRTGGRNVVLLGDKEVTYDDKFRLYITTKLPNPVLTPELQVKLTVLNFTVTREGLEEQLLADIVGTERAELQRSSDRCIVSIAANRSEIRALEEQVLKMLNEAKGDVLDNIDLINALQTSKTTSDNIVKELQVVEETNAKISATREKYRPLATRGSLIYGVIADLAKVDPMYEYSLQFFKGLVVSVLEATQKKAQAAEGEDGAEAENPPEETDGSGEDADKAVSDEAVEERVRMLTEEVTWTSFRVICRGLFERHKLLFSFLLATTVMKSVNSITEDEWEMFLRGGVGRTLPNEFLEEGHGPEYLSTVAWTDLGALCYTHSFQALGQDLFIHRSTWDNWFQNVYGEEVLAQLPQPIRDLRLWHQLMLIKAIRPEKLHDMVKALVLEELGDRYTRAPAFSIKEAFLDSTKLTPIIFVLSPGTDPTVLFCTFADEMGFAEKKYMLSLGQDQGPRAQKMVEDGRKEGCWVYLQNCHVYASWMPKLQQLVENIDPKETHEDFRLWLTSSPSPSFPAAVLQAGMKLTREPPLGLKGKVRDTLSIQTVLEAWGGKPADANDEEEEDLDAEDSESSPKEVKFDVRKTARWKRLAFTLAIFHGVIMERRQFCPLGWNQAYEWAAPDYAAGLCTITTALSRFTEEEPTPWIELCFMLGTIDYGGRVTDMWDTRCLEVIAKQFFSAEAEERQRGSTNQHSIGHMPTIPEDCTYEELIHFVETQVPDDANPEMYGLHENARISVDRKHSADLVTALVNINAGGGGGGGGASKAAGKKDNGEHQEDEEDGEKAEEEDPVMQQAHSLLERLPHLIERAEAVVTVDDSGRPSAEAPLKTLLSHEVDLYNRLIIEMKKNLEELIRAMKGQVVMTSKMEQIAARLGYNQVPDTWRNVGYLTMKPLGSYFEDFLRRIAFVDSWRRNGPQPSFWLPGLFFPQGFITAVLQSRSRALHVPIDSLHFRFKALRLDEGQKAKTEHTLGLVGAYVHGIFLEGCGWDYEQCGLVESRPGALTTELPVLHFEPVQADVPDHYETIYDCPLYKVSSRAGTLSTTGVSTNYIVTLGLPSLHGVPGDHWTLRGVAGLCSLDA